MPVMCVDERQEDRRRQLKRTAASTNCVQQARDFKRFCGLLGIQGQNIRSVGNLGPWDLWDLWTTQCREIQIGS